MTTIILLSLLILLHELGHYLVAKLIGIKVEEFGIGIPPKAIKLFTWRETEFTLNWLPLGGFVRLAGEDHDPSLWEKLNPFLRKKMFFARPPWQRVLVIVAGVVVNFVVGVLAFATIYSVLGVPKETGEQVMISNVVPNSPAAQADLVVGEVVTQINDEPITTAAAFVERIGAHKGRVVTLWVSTVTPQGARSDESRVITVTPRENPPEGEGALGVSVSTVPILTYEKLPWYQAPIAGVVEGIKEALGWSKMFLDIFLHPSELIKNIGGPVQVVKVGQQAVAMGWEVTLRFVGIISLNLAIFNLLPIPALDGGRLLMVGLEKIIGRKRVAKAEQYVNAVGMGLLILLLIGVTIKDIWFS
jgi:regulator of sigma E protease